MSRAVASVVSLLAAAAIAGCSSNAAAPDAAFDLGGEGLFFKDLGGAPQEDGGGVPKPDTIVDPDDWDGDGLSNDLELQIGTDPSNPDTDNDGKGDKEEVGDNPQAPVDSDNDGKADATEPDDFDSDKDGKNDNVDTDDTDGPCGALPRLFLNATLTKDATMTKACSPYKVLGHLYVINSAKLTIEAGVEVRFGPQAFLQLGNTATLGSLAAQGQAGEQVTLTADSSAPTPGSWRGVVAETAKSLSLVHASLRYAGGPNNASLPQAHLLVQSISGQLTLQNSSFVQGLGAGLHVTLRKAGSGALFAGFRDNVFNQLGHAVTLNIAHVGEIGQNNDFKGAGATGEIRVVEGVVDRQASWRDPGPDVRYVLLASQIAIEEELTIKSGVTIEVAQETEINVGFSQVSGKLRCQGSGAEPVVWTSKSGTAGDWNGLLLWTSGNELTHTQLRGAGRNSTQNVAAPLYVAQGASLVAMAVGIDDSAGYGAYYYLVAGGCQKSPPKKSNFVFGLGVIKCKLYCLDDQNGQGECLAP
jgi:hypothetical protein